MLATAGSEGQTATIAIDGRPVTFTASSGPIGASADAAAALALLPAMKQRSPLEVGGVMSARLRQSLDAIQGIVAAWFGHSRVDIHAQTAERSTGAGVASFFSGGVDSFFTARRRDDIDTLIFVRGFDLQADQPALLERAGAAARDVARRLGKRLVEVTTDVRSYAPIGSDWGTCHGVAMAAVAHLLGFARVYIPATYTYADLFPWGSHPLLDPLWRTEGTEIVHDSADVGRFDKLAALAHDQVAQDHLRVCWENRDGAYNCSRCEKCTRTMILLRAHGVLERFHTFDRPLELRRVRFGELKETQVTSTRQGLRRLEESGADPKLASALRWRLRLGRHRLRAHLAARKLRHALK
jgi:hypothetical protein